MIFENLLTYAFSITLFGFIICGLNMIAANGKLQKQFTKATAVFGALFIATMLIILHHPGV